MTGQVQIDWPTAQQLIDQGSPAQIESMLLHEMGRVVGLGHAEGVDALMYRANDGTVNDFRDGDRAGLALLGSGPCVAEY